MLTFDGKLQPRLNELISIVIHIASETKDISAAMISVYVQECSENLYCNDYCVYLKTNSKV